MRTYQQSRENIEFMLRYYENKCPSYLTMTYLTLDDLDMLYRYDARMIERYTMDLLLLEARNILKIEL